MVREWLRQNGYELNVKWDEWEKDDRSVVGDYMLDNNLADALSHLSWRLGIEIQHVLNLINPRLRSGLPTDLAMDAHNHWLVGEKHSGVWLFRTRSSSSIRDIRDHGGFDGCYADLCHWSVDEHCNKIRYPEKDGEML